MRDAVALAVASAALSLGMNWFLSHAPDVMNLSRLSRPAGLNTGQPLSSARLHKLDGFVFATLQALFLAACLAYLAYVLNRFGGVGQIGRTDFMFFWFAGHVSSAEELLSAYNGGLFTLESASNQWQRWGAEPNYAVLAYPPHLVVLLQPLGLISYDVAFIVWEVASLAALGLAVWVVFGGSWRATRFVLFAPAVFACLWLGQSGLLASALLIAGIGLLERRPLLAGVLIGALTVKPTLGLLIPFALIAGGYWRALMSAAVTASALILLSLVLYGLEPWLAFVSRVPGYQISFHEGQDHLLVLNLSPTVYMAARVLGFGAVVGYVAQAIVFLAVAVSIVWAFRSHRDFAVNCALLFVGTILASPFIHSYDMSCVTVGIYILLQDMLLKGEYPGERSIAVLTWFLPVLVFFMNGAAHIPIGPVILGILFAALLRRLMMPGRAPSVVGRHEVASR